MKKRCALLLLLAALLLGGCSVFDREYVAIQDYTPHPQEQNTPEGKIQVRSFSGLRQAILNMAYAGQTEGTIVFDAAYDGDPTEDMASACWAVRTQGALCAYCVENITYELNKIVTINEASMYISYSGVTVSPDEIEHLSFSSEAETELLAAMSRGERRIALLVGRSGFSADEMAAQVVKAYRENPTVVPREPRASVTMYSGTGAQRLYEVVFNYGMGTEELNRKREELSAFDPFASLETETLSDAERAWTAFRYLADNCTLDEESGLNTAYAALIGGKADSEGFAFGFVELCGRLGLDCRIVYGQYAWEEHCWNIVRFGGSSYHADVSKAAVNGFENTFLKNDEDFWGAYRWDVSSYPKCTGRIDLSELFPGETETEDLFPPEEPTEAEAGEGPNGEAAPGENSENSEGENKT